MSEHEPAIIDDEPSEMDDAPLYGVTLRQCAAIRAALAEGFGLDDVLRKERTQQHDWNRADAKWEKRFGADPRLEKRFEAELAAAEDWLWRDVSPIDNDETAWAAFYVAYSASPDGMRFLARFQLGKNDISRLVRRWTKRAASDPGLARRLSQLPSKSEPPLLSVSPKALKRARPGGAAAATPNPAATNALLVTPPNDVAAKTEPEDDLGVFVFGVDRYASLCAELEVFPKEAERVRNKYKLATEADRFVLEQRMRTHLAASPDHERDYRTQYQRALSRARKLAETTTLEQRIAATRKQDEPDTSKPTITALPTPELGGFFTPPVELAPATPSPIVASPMDVPEKPTTPDPPVGTAGATQDVASVLASLSAPALPFVVDDVTATSEVLARIDAIPDATPGDSSDKPEAGGTQDVSSLLEKAELPSGWQDRAQAPAPITAAPMQPTDVSPSKPAQQTSQQPTPRVPEKPMRASPTNPGWAAAPGVPALPELTLEQYAVLCVELETHSNRLGDVLARYHLQSNSLETLHAVWRRRLAYDAPARDAFGRAMMDYKVWLAGQGRAAPRLTMEQYASLLVDLSMDPARRAETLQRYRIDEATKTSLDQGFKQQFDADPRARAAFDQATHTYRAWLAAGRR